ncbi:MAG: hypothetical protein GWP91_23440 [Rhodobacterales bacterium]|nr:hypothetical protein [Rhodobacterales bacterium]
MDGERIRALGFSQTEFNPHDPGRLCRGRERWITPWDLDEGEEPPVLHRLTITGAHFENDSARNAMRGINHAGFETAQVINKLFPRKKLLAFMEDGHPADIPELAEGVELYDGHRAGGLSTVPCVRWHQTVSGIKQLQHLLNDPMKDRVRGFAVLPSDRSVEELADLLYPLVSLSTLDSPPARFQPAVLDEVLNHVDTLILLHRDKQGPALGVYSRKPFDGSAKLQALADSKTTLLVPFAIPPMLARWDRALWEMRQKWEVDHEEPFPVPQASDPSAWDPRRRDRRRRKNKPLEDETLAAEEPPSTRLTSPADESMIDFDDVLLVSSGPAHEE